MIKYRLPSYKEGAVTKGEEFSRLQPVYRLNKVTNQLELTDEVIDITELANSCRDMALSSILDSFLPTENNDGIAVAYDNSLDALDKMRDIANLSEKYKQELNLDPSMSIQDVFKKVEEHSLQLKNRIAQMQNKSEVKKDEKEDK